MKIAYVGDFVNHGKSLAPTGTSIVFILSTMDEVEMIDIYCPRQNDEIEEITLPSKVKIIYTYEYNNPLSILKLMKIRQSYYDRIIFNMLSTSFGNTSIANAIGIILPILLVKIFRMKNIEVIYHNSVLTNDISKLGYNSIFDRFRAGVLRHIEIFLFKNVETFVLLQLYKEKIDVILNKNRVKYLNAKYLEAFATLFINEVQNNGEIKIERADDLKKVLLHGNWGPQKNIELALSALKKINGEGISFKLVITGAINYHFPEYEDYFINVLEKFNFTENYVGPVKEKDIFKLFTTSDLILLPYNTPGGHSAVLEQAIFFEVPTVAIDFPEYREQAFGCNFVSFSNTTEFCENVKAALINLKRSDKIEIKNKIEIARNNIKELLLV